MWARSPTRGSAIQACTRPHRSRTWDAVQATACPEQSSPPRQGASKNPSLLAGLLFDDRARSSSRRTPTSRASAIATTSARPAESSPTDGSPRSKEPAPTVSSPPGVFRPGGRGCGSSLARRCPEIGTGCWPWPHPTRMPLSRPCGSFRRLRQHSREDPIAKRELLLALLERAMLRDGQIELRLRASALRSHPDAYGGDEGCSRAVGARRDPSCCPAPARGGDASRARGSRACRARARCGADQGARSGAPLVQRDLLDRQFKAIRILARAYDTDERYVSRRFPAGLSRARADP